MKWTAGRVTALIVVVGILALLLYQQSQAPSTPQASGTTQHSAQAQAGQQNGTAAQPGPSINQQARDADTQRAANKLILGVVCVLLLVIVFFGRRGRNKHRSRLKNLQNAKA